MCQKSTNEINANVFKRMLVSIEIEIKEIEDNILAI